MECFIPPLIKSDNLARAIIYDYYYPVCAARGLKMLVSVVGCRRCHKQAP